MTGWAVLPCMLSLQPRPSWHPTLRQSQPLTLLPRPGQLLPGLQRLSVRLSSSGSTASVCPCKRGLCHWDHASCIFHCHQAQPCRASGAVGHPAAPACPAPGPRSPAGSLGAGEQHAGLELPYAAHPAAPGLLPGVPCLCHTCAGSHTPREPLANCSPADGGAGQSSAAGGTGIQRLCLFLAVCGSRGSGRRAGTQSWSSVCRRCTHPALGHGRELLLLLRACSLPNTSVCSV